MGRRRGVTLEGIGVGIGNAVCDKWKKAGLVEGKLGGWGGEIEEGKTSYLGMIAQCALISCWIHVFLNG